MYFASLSERYEDRRVLHESNDCYEIGYGTRKNFDKNIDYCVSIIASLERGPPPRKPSLLLLRITEPFMKMLKRRQMEVIHYVKGLKGIVSFMVFMRSKTIPRHTFPQRNLMKEGDSFGQYYLGLSYQKTEGVRQDISEETS